MKPQRIAGLAVALTLGLASLASSQTIVGSDHDFSAKGWGSTEVCIFCHTAHNAKTGVVGAPLWNHQVTATASFTVYSSTTLNATMGQPDGTSKLCLSCHDGTVAVDNFGTTTTGTNIVTGTALVGTNLSNDHPVSFTYDAALVGLDPGLKLTTTSSGLGGTIAADMLFGGKVECASCHDAHNGAGLAKLLRKTNAASALCLTCHNK
jgi:predicted CXXCH cytochrome family protein